MNRDPKGSFSTHSNYVRAFAQLGGFVPGLLPSAKALLRLRQRVLASGDVPKPSTGAIDLTAVRRSLVNAWGTELLIVLSGKFAEEDELLRIVNNWAVVQVYYVGYHATQALFIAKGSSRPESHPKTQNLFVAQWVNRSLLIAPWTFGVSGSGFHNGPVNRVIDDTIHAWRRCDGETCWDLAGKALRTTRAEAVAEAIRRARDEKRRRLRQAWREQERDRLERGRQARREPTFPLPHLDAAEKARSVERVRAYGLLDYLYRLRIKTNYEDAAMFTDGPSDESSSAQVHADLAFLASGTLLLHEMYIAALVGKREMGKWIDSWIGSHLSADLGNIGIGSRRALVLG